MMTQFIIVLFQLKDYIKNEVITGEKLKRVATFSQEMLRI